MEPISDVDGDYSSRSSIIAGMTENGQLLSLVGPLSHMYVPQSFEYPGSIFKSEEDFNLYEQFNKGEKQNSLGPLFKVKHLDNDMHPAIPLVARVIHFKKVQRNVIDKVFHEATILKSFSAADVLLPIEGIVFNERTNAMHIFYP